MEVEGAHDGDSKGGEAASSLVETRGGAEPHGGDVPSFEEGLELCLGYQEVGVESVELKDGGDTFLDHDVALVRSPAEEVYGA